MTSEAVTLRAKLYRLVTEFGDASMDYGIFGGSDNPAERRADATARLSATRMALQDAIYEVCDRLRDYEGQRPPTAAEQAGMDWWNALSESERGKWLERVGGDASAADAWALYKKAESVVRDVVALDHQLAAIEKGA